MALDKTKIVDDLSNATVIEIAADSDAAKKKLEEAGAKVEVK